MPEIQPLVPQRLQWNGFASVKGGAVSTGPAV